MIVVSVVVGVSVVSVVPVPVVLDGVGSSGVDAVDAKSIYRSHAGR